MSKQGKPTQRVRSQYKLIVVGDSGVGKTSLLQRCFFGQFHENNPQTMGINIVNTTYTVQDRSGQYAIGLEIWEFGGQREFLPIWSQYLKSAHGALLAFDLTAPSTLESLKFWKALIIQHAGTIPMHIVGTKRDIWIENVLFDDIFLVVLQHELNIWKYTESSAKSALNVDQVFKNIVQEILHAQNPQDPPQILE